MFLNKDSPILSSLAKHHHKTRNMMQKLIKTIRPSITPRVPMLFYQISFRYQLKAEVPYISHDETREIYV